jgi:predicted dehydrogenase
MFHRICLALFIVFTATCAAIADDNPKLIRVGIIGLDTSHAPAFTKILNDPKATGDLAGIRVVAAFPGGSPDIESSRSRVDEYTKQLQAMGVEIVDSIPTLLSKVDVVLIESVDGRPHLAQVRPVFAAGKPVFIDKPLAGSLVDSLVIAELGARHKVPWFSASALRFGPSVAQLKSDPKIGEITGCDAWSPCALEPSHPDLYWYGIHGCEMLYAFMGTGCQSVTRTHAEGTDFVTGVWKDGRIGTFRGTRLGTHDYGAIVFGVKGNGDVMKFEGYEPLLHQIAIFFRTGKPPVTTEETIEVMTFMEAADESKRQGGVPVKLETVLAKAREEANAKLEKEAK